MAFSQWLQRIFVPEKGEDAEVESTELGSTSFFESGQHVRIIWAIMIVFASAAVMWWILV